MSNALQSAFRRGFEDGFKGRPRSENPYPDLRNDGGKITWSRAFRNAWHDGWDRGNSQRLVDEE
jgi:ribosome modulation factor